MHWSEDLIAYVGSGAAPGIGGYGDQWLPDAVVQGVRKTKVDNDRAKALQIVQNDARSGLRTSDGQFFRFVHLGVNEKPPATIDEKTLNGWSIIDKSAFGVNLTSQANPPAFLISRSPAAIGGSFRVLQGRVDEAAAGVIKIVLK